tara:strand:- start:13 stop:297 length:285 start_codon:yes stop_codon:yes gene_type:complete
MNNKINNEKEFIRSIASRIHQSGFITPAIFFLELTKPLSLIGSHAMIFFGPIINAFINTEDYYKAAEIFEKSENIELLIQEIENLEENIVHVER